MMKVLPLLMVCLVYATTIRAETRCELDCLICDQVKDPESYVEGAMKSMKYVVPGFANWLFRSEVDLSNEFGIPEDMEDNFADLIAAFNQQGIQVAVAVQPTRGLMHRDKIRPDWSGGFQYDEAYANLSAFLMQLRRSGAIVPDILPLVASPPAEDYFFRRDHHWTPSGARVTAEIVAAAIKQAPVYETLTLKDYIIETSVIIPKDGTMNTALRRLCSNNYSFQYVQGFQSIPADTGSDALFGDSAEPEVVLVGTSNSAARDDEVKNYNFDGFLKAFLKADLLNYALPGSGQDGSLIQYLQSEDYDPNNPPKLIIWELPASYRMETELSYRQLIPAIKGGCRDGSETLLSSSLPDTQLVQGERLEVLQNAGANRKQVKEKNAFLSFNFSDSRLKDFYVIVYYDNGQRDKVWFRREAVVDGYQYYLSLSDKPELQNANLLSVFIEPSEPVEFPLSIEAKLCI
jgi:alginate biosynthesis protein AlgX